MDRNLYKHKGQKEPLVSKVITPAMRKGWKDGQHSGQDWRSEYWQYRPDWEPVIEYTPELCCFEETWKPAESQLQHLRKVLNLTGFESGNPYGLPKSLSTKGLEAIMRAEGGDASNGYWYSDWNEGMEVSTGLCHMLIDLFSEARNRVQVQRVKRTMDKKGYSFRESQEYNALMALWLPMKSVAKVSRAINQRRHSSVKTYKRFYTLLKGVLMRTYGIVKFQGVVIISNMDGSENHVFRQDEFEAFWHESFVGIFNDTNMVLNCMEKLQAKMGNSIPLELYEFLDGYPSRFALQSVLKCFDIVLFRSVRETALATEDLAGYSSNDISKKFHLLNKHGEIPFRKQRELYERVEGYLSQPRLAFLNDYTPARTIRLLYKRVKRDKQTIAKRLDDVKWYDLQLYQLICRRAENKEYLGWRKTCRFICRRPRPLGLDEVGVENADAEPRDFCILDDSRKTSAVSEFKYAMRARV